MLENSHDQTRTVIVSNIHLWLFYLFTLFDFIGKSAARLAEEVAINAAQEAKRAAVTAQEFMRKAKEAADKAQRAIQVAEATKSQEWYSNLGEIDDSSRKSVQRNTQFWILISEGMLYLYHQH